MNDSEVLDPAALERLKEWGGEKLAGQMVRLFLKNSGVRMDQIRVGVGEADVEEAERGAHSLKSSAANIGAERLRTLATQVESAALTDDHEQLREILPDLEDAYAVVMSTLEVLEQAMPEQEGSDEL